jgi:hypothetical protein
VALLLKYFSKIELMKIAILVVGHLRNSLSNNELKQFITKFVKEFEVCDIFFTIWDKYEALVNNNDKECTF